METCIIELIVRSKRNPKFRNLSTSNSFSYLISFLCCSLGLPRDRSHCAPQRIWRLSIGTRHQYININTWQNRYINVGQRCWVSCHPCITRRWNSSASTWRITLLHCGKRMCRIRDRTMFESELLTRASAGPIFIYWKYVVALLVSFLSVCIPTRSFRSTVFNCWSDIWNNVKILLSSTMQDNVYEKISFFFN